MIDLHDEAGRILVADSPRLSHRIGLRIQEEKCGLPFLPCIAVNSEVKSLGPRRRTDPLEPFGGVSRHPHADQYEGRRQ